MTKVSPGLGQSGFRQPDGYDPIAVLVAGDRFVPGGAFLLDAPVTVPAVWGGGDTVAWAQGEALWIVGPAGVGKTTIEGQLVRGRVGLQAELLGMPVEPDGRRVLILAMDRPRQIARALRRIFTDAERELLNERLEVWPGPLPFDLAADPAALAGMALERGIGTVFIDSAKDAAVELSRDDVGSRFNRAIQMLLAAEVEVCVLHHQRKAQAQNPKPRRLADVYGSTWLTAGAGSVLLLWGNPGDPVVELQTLKPAVGEIGPLSIVHDHERGISSLQDSPDLAAIASDSRAGITVTEAAISLYGENPSKADRERARRRLVALTRGEAAELERVDGDPPRYRSRDPRDPPRDPLTAEDTEDTEPHEQAARNGSRGDTSPLSDTAPPYRGRVPESVTLAASELGVELWDE